MPLVASEAGLTYLQVGLVNSWIVGGANDSVDLDIRRYQALWILYIFGRS